MLFLIVCVATQTISQPKNTQTPKEEVLEIWKDMCITKWTEQQSLKSLTRFGITVAGLCTCTQQELTFMLTESQAVMFKNSFDRFLKSEGYEMTPSKEAFEIALQEIGKLDAASQRGCIEKLRRR